MSGVPGAVPGDTTPGRGCRGPVKTWPGRGPEGMGRTAPGTGRAEVTLELAPGLATGVAGGGGGAVQGEWEPALAKLPEQVSAALREQGRAAHKQEPNGATRPEADGTVQPPTGVGARSAQPVFPALQRELKRLPKALPHPLVSVQPKKAAGHCWLQSFPLALLEQQQGRAPASRGAEEALPPSPNREPAAHDGRWFRPCRACLPVEKGRVWAPSDPATGSQHLRRQSSNASFR